MITRLTFDTLPTFALLHQQFLQEAPRQGIDCPSFEQAVASMRSGHMTCILWHGGGGYCLFHLADWAGSQVLWIDALYLLPKFRKQQHLKDIVQWLSLYCEVNGIGACMGLVTTFAEGDIFKRHLHAEPVAQVLRVAASHLVYHPSSVSLPQEALGATYHAPVPAIGQEPANANGQQTPPKKRRRRTKHGEIPDTEIKDTSSPALSSAYPELVRERFPFPLTHAPEKM